MTTAASSGYTAQTVAYAIEIKDAVAVAHLIQTGQSGNGIVLGTPAFLGVADLPSVLDAILTAAAIVGGADACEVRLRDPGTDTLRTVRRRGAAVEPGDTYPLRTDDGRLLGVLSMHSRGGRSRPGRPELVARYASRALAHLAPFPAAGKL